MQYADKRNQGDGDVNEALHDAPRARIKVQPVLQIEREREQAHANHSDQREQPHAAVGDIFKIGHVSAPGMRSNDTGGGPHLTTTDVANRRQRIICRFLSRQPWKPNA
jgi:hypothetical protein